MWVLKTEGPLASMTQYVLYAGKHEIGRSGPKPENTVCDGWISFPGVDKSISRNHASITVRALGDPHVMEQRQPICIRDKSKFGVSIDDVDESYREKSVQTSQASQKSVHQIQKDTDVPLTQGCSITVGVNNSRLRLEWEDLVACHSLLSKDQAAALLTSCAQLGIHVSKTWSERVRLLVMHQVQMTPKLLLALIDQKDIVTPDYMTALRNRAGLKDPIPDPLTYDAVWEAIRDEAQNRIKHWRHRISGETREHEPSPNEMSKCFLFRPGFVEGFPVDFKPFLMPNERSKGSGSKSHARASLFVNRVLVFVQGDSGANVRQYKQVCEKAKAKVEVWEAAQVVKQWPAYQTKLTSSDKKCTWHVLLSEQEERKGAVEEAVLRLRSAGAIYSSLDSVWKAIVKADASCISKDELEPGWSTQSLDSSAQPDTLCSLSLPCSSFQHTASLQEGREVKTDKTNKKRQRQDQGAELVKASPHAVKSSDGGGQAGNRAQGGEVIEIVEDADSLAKPRSPAAGRASKRTRGGCAPVPAPVPAAMPASPAAGGSARGSGAAATQGRAGIVASDKSPHTASSATTRQQRDVEKQDENALQGKEGKASKEGKESKDATEAGKVPSRTSPMTRAPTGSPAKPACDTQVPGTRVRTVPSAEPAGQIGAHAPTSEAADEGKDGVSSAASARPARRRFQVQDEADPEGWVGIVSDGPAPRLSMSAAVSAQIRAGGAARMSPGAVVNFKRFLKKSNGAPGIRKDNAVAQPVIAFEVWPKRAAAAANVGPAAAAGPDGSRGGVGARPGRRAAGGGKALAARRRWGSDDSADELA